MAVVLILAPSVLFVLLYRGLMKLQDQELIARLAEAGHLDPASIERIEGTDGHEETREAEPERRRTGSVGRNAGASRRRAAFLRERGGTDSGSTTADRTRDEAVAEGSDVQETVRCEHCGSENTAEFGLCWNCLEWLD
jgi:hypothetical protein